MSAPPAMASTASVSFIGLISSFNVIILMRNAYAFKVFVAGTDLKMLLQSESSNNE
jgi:hypothetical protein